MNTRDLAALVAKAILGSTLLRIVGMGFGLLVGMQLARALQADGYGIYGVAMSVMTLLMLPVEIGLPRLVTREVSAAYAQGNDGKMVGIAGWSRRVVMLLSFAVMTVSAGGILIFGGWLRPELTTTLLVSLLLIPTIAVANIDSAAVRGSQQVIRGQIPEALIRPACHSLLLFGVASQGHAITPPSAMVLGLASAALALLVALMARRGALPRTFPEPVSRDEARRMWTSAIPMFLAEGMLVVRSHAQIILIGLISVAAVAGVYRVAGSISLLISIPITIINVGCAPIIARLHAQQNIEQLTRLSMWISVVATVGTTVLLSPFLAAGPQILVALFGPEFASANSPLIIIAAGTILSAAMGASALILNMTGNERCVTRSAVFSLLALFITSPPLIARWGAVGAAASNAMSAVLWGLLMRRDVMHKLGFDPSIFGCLLGRK